MNDVIKMLNKGHDPNYQDFKTGGLLINIKWPLIIIIIIIIIIVVIIIIIIIIIVVVVVIIIIILLSETPMTVAILGGAPKELLVRLVEEGAHLDYRNTCEMTPVHVAAINGKVEYLKVVQI